MIVIFAEREFDHYAASGENASYVVRSQYDTPGRGPQSTTTTTICLRKGRKEENEAVQMEICIRRDFEKASRQEYGTLAFTPEMWAAIVEFVQKNRSVEHLPFPEQKKRTPQQLIEYGLAR